MSTHEINKDRVIIALAPRLRPRILGLSLPILSFIVLACGPALDSDSMPAVELSVRAEPAGQMFESELTVQLLSSRPAQIFYTLDGSDPSANAKAAQSYDGPIFLSEQTLLSFIAVADDGSWSNAQTELYLQREMQAPPMPAPRMLNLTTDILFFEGSPGKTDPIYRAITLRSSGSETVDIKSVKLQSNPSQSIFYDPDAFDIVTEIPPGPLAPGESITVELMYKPSPTLRSDVLRITSDEQRHGGVQTVELWGRIADW
jgi:hypothetical protein